MPSALILSRPGYPAMPRAGQPAHQRAVLPNPLVLGETLLKFPTPTADRDQPVSRRFQPSSRTAFIGEQPNPWDLLQPQDAMSRHRGAKPPRRCERSEEISLLSPEYLLSVAYHHSFRCLANQFVVWTFPSSSRLLNGDEDACHQVSTPSPSLFRATDLG